MLRDQPDIIIATPNALSTSIHVRHCGSNHSNATAKNDKGVKQISHFYRSGSRSAMTKTDAAVAKIYVTSSERQ